MSVSVFVDVAASAVDTVESVVAVTEAETAVVDVSGVNAVAVEITVVFAEILYMFTLQNLMLSRLVTEKWQFFPELCLCHLCSGG